MENCTIFSWLYYNSNNVFKDYNVHRKSDFSYCINDSKANDLRIIKHYKLNPDTIYYVLVDIKTENVVNTQNKENPIGACISTNDWFCSKSLFSTNDWLTVGILGRTDNEGKIYVSFNLGYTCNACIGTAWFENIRFIPMDKLNFHDNTWRFLAVIVRESELDTFDESLNENIHLEHQMSIDEINAIRDSLYRFEEDFNIDAEGLFNVKVDILETSVKFKDYTKISMGYTASAPSSRKYLEEVGVDILSYDHIIMIISQPSLSASYFGLGGINIKGQVGYSFILHLNINDSIQYLKNEQKESWSSAIYIHEFLHSIESLSKSLNFEVPMVDGDRFNYPSDQEYRLWYKDFIHNNIVVDGKRLGVDPRIFKLRPSLLNNYLKYDIF